MDFDTQLLQDYLFRSMNYFTKIRIAGFRRHKDVTINLAPLNVMIGANGSGKSSLLEVCSLLAASASGGFRARISKLGGVDANLTAIEEINSKKPRALQFELTQTVAGFAPLEYSLAIRPAGVHYEITSERLQQYNNGINNPPFIHLENQDGMVRYFDDSEQKLVPPTWDCRQEETALAQVPRLYKETENFRNILASSTHYHALDVGPRAPVRLPQAMREAHLPGSDGEDLVSCLYWLRETSPDSFDIIEDTLRAAFPKFERLNFPPIATGMLALTWKETGMKQPFYLHQLSEGTLRFLWLVTLLYSPGLTKVTMLDEPEVSLHPELLAILADCLRDASTRTQLIVATHSDRLIRFLQPDEVMILDIDDDGLSSITRGDELDIGEWLKDYTLDELWQNGTLGARA